MASTIAIKMAVPTETITVRFPDSSVARCWNRLITQTVPTTRTSREVISTLETARATRKIAGIATHSGPIMTANDLRRYMETIPQARKNRFKSLHGLILELYPEVEISFRYKMPTYEWQGGWVALANQKNYLSLYTCGAQHLREFKQHHPDIKTGKGCINFRDRDDIPLADLVGVIHSTMKSHTN